MASKFDKQAVAAVLKGDDGYAANILAAAMDVVDGDIAAMEHMELVAAVNDAYGCIMSEDAESKLGAAVTALTTDYWSVSPELFKAMALAFSSGDVGDGDDDLSACEALWAVMECAVIRGESFEDVADALTADVTGMVNRIVASEAEDKEDAGDGDDLEDRLETPYYGRYVNTMLMRLVGQTMEIASKDADAAAAVRAACNELLEENGVSVPDTEPTSN